MVENRVRVEAKGDTELVLTRDFNAPRELVYRAYTECKYMRQWLTGMEGWSLEVCEVDLRVGGKYRWVWRKKDMSMGAGGEYRELERPAKIVCTEQFDDPWYEGEALSTVEFAENNGITTLVNTMSYSSKEARDGVLASPMEDGLEISYKRLDDLLETESAQAASSGD
jgi:uncharacterized protein YndB with AHSA1/START domain